MANNKRTLWIVSELFPPDETSTAYILGEVANAMVEKYDVKVICGPEIYDKRKKINQNNHFVLDKTIELFRVSSLDVDKNTVKGKIESVFSSSLKIAKEVRKRVNKEDVVLMVTNPFPLIVLMARLKKRIGFELHVLVHDIFPENAKPANVTVPMLPIVKKLFDRAYATADQLIALGRDMKEILEAKVEDYDNKPRVVIIENWADVINIKPKPRNNNGIITIEYAGNIGRGQGLKQFIEMLAISRNKSIRFDLYGTGAVEESLKKDVVATGINDTVTFNGSYYRSEQNHVLNACDLALVTLADGLYGLGVPSKSYNIMAAGKAILYIGHPESEIALLIKEKNIGFVFSPLDQNGIVNFLTHLSAEKLHQIREMGIRARKVAEECYSEPYILAKFKRAI